MAEVSPFKAIRYDHTKVGGDLSKLIAPPYDVLDQSDKDALLAKSDRNIVAIDLPHLPPKSLGPQEAYDGAQAKLEAWRADGTLVQEEKPALYIFHQVFQHEGRTITRRKFFCRVRLRPFEDGVILPHEHTFGGPKADRLALTQMTGCNLSPIFGLYTDSQDNVGQAFAGILENNPDFSARMDGSESRVWIVTEGAAIDRVCSIMAEKPIYIADGHHRYCTALNYLEWFTETSGGPPPENHPARFVMFVLASMDDPGCLILPYHRALAGVDLSTVLGAWAPGTETVSTERADIVLVDGASGKEQGLRFTDRGKLAELEPGEVLPWRQLDAAYLHRYLIEELLKAKLGGEPAVRYVKSEEAARKTARSESGVALLVNATPIEHLRAVSEAGGLMPQKSTYFYPKVPTGLTINPLMP